MNSLQEFLKQKLKVLIVDDEKNTLEIFQRQLRDDFYVATVISATEALEKLNNEKYHLILTDLVMPEMSGIELLKILKKKYPHIPVLVISGNATIEMAVEAIKLGAEDFIEKPVEDLELLKLTIRKTLKLKWQTEEIERLHSILKKEFDRGDIVGNSLAIQQLLNKVKKIAPLDATVLITGETGVGKELFANIIHRNSKRKEKQLVTINCGSLPEHLLESMLFGHQKGAFTDAIRDKIGFFEEAHGGTLFLDEITETSSSFQIKLLRALEESRIRRVGGEKDIKIDVRIIAASNKDVEAEVKNGNFREDLFYRLNVIGLHIPPLRERPEDISLLAKYFVSYFAHKYGKPKVKLAHTTLDILQAYNWKGNVRELKNAMEYAVAMTNHNKIFANDLPEHIFQENNNKQRKIFQIFDSNFQQAKNNFEKTYLDILLEKHDGNISKAADVSGIKRQNLYDKINKYSIDLEKYRK
ncbi:MAG: sigma-54 dependent transcriptional regulator [Candidatus Cloacimonadota bacterium]|nr:sigma-54 dependent transcriptional regulator [Candidatus Cloacimonadota bacterium]